MTNDWQTARLGDLLKRVKEEIKLEDNVTYKEVTVRLWNKGVILRDEKQGIDIKTNRFSVRAGQLILSRIDVRNGAIGIVPRELDGAVVSGEFWTYAVDKTKMDSRFLALYVSTPRFLEESNRTSSGTTHRIRAEEETLLQIEIPFPPLAEQQRIVARVDALARRVEEARGLRRAAVEESSSILSSALDKIFKQLNLEFPLREIQQVCEVVRGGSPRPAGNPLYYGGEIPFIKVGDITKDDGKYLFKAESTVNELGKSQSRFITEDTLMLTNSGATLGVPKITKIAGCFNDGSQAFLNLSNDIFIEYLYYFLKSKTLWFREIPARGQGQPNLNTDMIKPLQFPCPPLADQRRIVAYLDGLQAKVDELRRLQAATQKELDALMPSILARAFAGEL